MRARDHSSLVETPTIPILLRRHLPTTTHGRANNFINVVTTTGVVMICLPPTRRASAALRGLARRPEAVRTVARSWYYPESRSWMSRLARRGLVAAPMPVGQVYGIGA
jgi:hypothetical protein